eukprot:TRINITY_DN8491_c0_g2_i1.p1 TRINITY_DN8491_c0_g2~~TRINITY_DN8491_c0_g2_i1.p1  ORF type:complete len:352 (+),score=43.36 TRINITY_DN8491_c0_g2_i1:79-1134(+)
MTYIQQLVEGITNDEFAMMQSMIQHQAFNIVFFMVLNLIWMSKINAGIHTVRLFHYAALLSIILWWGRLDSKYPDVDVLFLAVRGHIGGLTIALVDFMFSKTGFLMIPSILLGNAIWMVTYGIMLHFAVGVTGFPTRGLPVADSIYSIVPLYISTYFIFVMSGLSSDLFFSPVHRLLHSRWLRKFHTEHHKFTELCGPILYKASAIDDVIMSLCAAAGHSLLIAVLLQLGLGSFYYSIIPSFVALMLPYSHASDMGLVNLFFTVPGRLNYIAYHRMHHMNQDLNYGLTAIGDKLWDRILGTTTVSVPFEGFTRQRELGPRKVSSPLFKEKTCSSTGTKKKNKKGKAAAGFN